MTFAQALYYPRIDVPDEGWLKTATLYWESVRTIVPESIQEPYASETARALQAADFLVPLRVHPSMEEIDELTDDVMTYLDSREGTEVLLGSEGSRGTRIHVDKLPLRLARMHPEKLPHEIRHRLASLSGEGDWLDVDEGFGLFYMTLLATRLAERVGAALLTPLPPAESLAMTARLDSRLPPFGPRYRARSWREYGAWGRRRPIPSTLARGLLAQVAIENIAVAPDTPIDQLLDFKSKHRDELANFRNKISELASSVEGEDLPIEAMRERVSTIYNDEVVPAMTTLKSALAGRRIRTISEGLLRIAFLSTGPTSLLVAAGLPVPTALLAGAGISIVASGTIYNQDRQDALKSNPYAYLLAIERELSWKP